MTTVDHPLPPTTTLPQTPELRPGLDFRLPQFRREVFLRFYSFHLRYRAHPGCVYYLLPALRTADAWSDDDALWFAFLNGNTQHPPTSRLLFLAWRERGVTGMLEFFADHYTSLTFDTDRRHHKKAFPLAVRGYLRLVARVGSQQDYWLRACAGGWPAVWRAALAIPTFARLSAFSYTEYLRIIGLPFDCGSLMLDDIPGSRSHRNGLCRVLGYDAYDWHPQSNPRFNGRYPTAILAHLELEAASLLAEARTRDADAPWSGDISYFTLESALCTYKSWHRPNRRYPNVYNDMLYDRLRATERTWGDAATRPFWEARRTALPAHLRLEDTPTDPGCVPVKQNHYRLTGQVIMMDREWSCFQNDFNDAVLRGDFGLRPT